MLTPLAERRLNAELGFQVVRADGIEPWQAHNNQLEHVWSADGREVVVKTYYDDDRRRLDREFTALVFLRAHGILELPTPLLRDDEHHFAVYSFEPGATGPGSSLTSCAVTRIAEFAAKLHAIGLDVRGAAHFRTSVSATFSFADMVRGTRARLAQFTARAASMDDPPLAHTDWQSEIESLISQALGGAEAALAGVARSAVEVLTGGAEVGRCRAPGCVLFFARDARHREWCSLACGNRARVAEARLARAKALLPTLV